MFADLRHRFATVSAAAPRVYWYVWWGTLVNRLGGFVVPLLALYLTRERGLTLGDVGSVVAVFGAGNILASIVGGQLADRLGRRRTMLISLFGGAASMAVLGFAQDLTTIIVMVGVTSFLGELYRPAVLAFVSDVVPPAHRTAAFGLLYWAINLGFAFAAMIGGFVAEVDFGILFLADAITMAIYGVIIFVCVPETKPVLTAREEQADVRPWTDRVFVVFVLINMLVVLLPMQVHTALPAHMLWQGMTAGDYGLVMSVNGFLIILIQPFVITWSERQDTQRILILAALLYGVGMFTHGLAAGVVTHIGAVAIWTLGEILESPTRSTVVAALAPASARGRYQGLFVMSWGVGQLVGPKIGTHVWQDIGPRALWTGCLVLSVVAALALWVTAASRRARMELATDPSRTGSS